MKAKYSIGLLVFGYCLDFIGGLLKIMHMGMADAVLVIAAICKISGAVLFLYKLTSYPKWKDFLNS
jgi:hypothetical protein